VTDLTVSDEEYIVMPAGRIATVSPVAEAAATGKVAAVYTDIKQTKKLDSVPNFWRVLATNPDHLEMVWTRLKAIMHPEAVSRTSKLDPVTREIIAVAVSATNGCAYCVNSHTAALRKLGMDAETLGEVMAVVGLFNSTNALADAYQVEPDVLPPVD
jgi:AhpD family alkylhydroperoxidase